MAVQHISSSSSSLHLKLVLLPPTTHCHFLSLWPQFEELFFIFFTNPLLFWFPSFTLETDLCRLFFLSSFGESNLLTAYSDDCGTLTFVTIPFPVSCGCSANFAFSCQNSPNCGCIRRDTISISTQQQQEEEQRTTDNFFLLFFQPRSTRVWFRNRRKNKNWVLFLVREQLVNRLQGRFRRGHTATTMATVKWPVRISEGADVGGAKKKQKKILSLTNLLKPRRLLQLQTLFIQR